MSEKEISFPIEKENRELKISRIITSINKLAVEKNPDEQNRITIKAEEIKNEIGDDCEDIINSIEEAVNRFKNKGIEISYDENKEEIILTNKEGIDVEVVEGKRKEVETNPKKLGKVFSVIENELKEIKEKGRYEISVILEAEEQEILKENRKGNFEKLSEMIKEYLTNEVHKNTNCELHYDNSSFSLKIEISIE